jgi:DNA polymerase-3 subunit delta'
MPLLSNTLVSNNSITKLQSLINNIDNTNHSILLSHPFSLDIDSVAKLLATSFQCETGGCENCEICSSTSNRSNIDIHYIKPVLKQYRVRETGAAKRRLGETFIDEIRLLSIKSPSNSKFNIIVVFDVEKLGTNSDILLKSIEEPPLRTIFILTTSSLSKVPRTIKSRCYKINLIAPSNIDITNQLVNEGFNEENIKDIIEIYGTNISTIRYLLNNFSEFTKRSEIISEMLDVSTTTKRFKLAGRIANTISNDAKTKLEKVAEGNEISKDDATQLEKNYKLDIYNELIEQFQNQLIKLASTNPKLVKSINNISQIKKQFSSNIPEILTLRTILLQI